MSPTNVLGEGHLTSFSNVSILGHPRLTNVAEIDLPFELFLTWSPAQRSFLNDPSIMKASAGTGNRKGKRIPRKNLFAGSGTFRHNESMKIEIEISDEEINDIIEALKDQGVDVTRTEVEAHYEEYFFAAVEDSQDERMDSITDSLIDLQD